MTYYNTTHVEGAELRDYQATAASQEEAVLAFFEDHPEREFTPEDVGRYVLPNAPRTSWGRALTNLTTEKKLERTERQVEGKYGRPIYTWRLAQHDPRQPELF